MFKRFAKILLLLVGVVSLWSCKEEDTRQFPVFGEIKVTPEKEVYDVGDVVTCTITMTQPGGETLKKSTYWWYASWMFQSTEYDVDFQEFKDNQCVSAPIKLTKAGDQKLYFFGRLEYPNYNWKKIEIAKTIKVKEAP